MAWDVDFHSLFVPEFEALGEDVQDELLAHIDALKVFGPQMGRPPWTRSPGPDTRT